MGRISCLPPTQSDIPAIVDLDQRSLGGLWSADGYRRELDSPNSCLRILVHPQNETALLNTGHQTGCTYDLLGIGCYWAILEEAHITVLGIDPRYQQQGLGQWLLLCLLEDACDRHLERATLEVRASNTGALALYNKFGFKALGTRHKYYPDGEDALILWQNSLKEPSFRSKLTSHHHHILARLTAQGWRIDAENLSVTRT